MRTQSNGLIQISGYQINTDIILGKGATGNVYKGVRTQDGLTVAVKAIDMAMINNQVTKYLLEGEKKALTEIKHPFVVKCEDIIQEKDYCYIVMEQCTGGTLRDFIKSRGSIPEAQAINLFRKITHAYCNIIDAKIIHRDLKATNIMLRANGDPAIIDFGYCEMIMGKKPLIRYNVGSPTYMSPQAYQNSRYSERSDVWALGIILHQMITGKTLDEGRDIKEYFQETKKRKVPNMNIGKFSQLIQNLLKSSLAVSVQQRASSHRLKYLIDISIGGPLLNPQGMKIRTDQPRQTKTPLRTLNRQTMNTDVSNFRVVDSSRNKYQQNRKSSLNFSSPYSPSMQYNSINNNLQPKMSFLERPNHNQNQINHQPNHLFSQGRPILFPKPKHNLNPNNINSNHHHHLRVIHIQRLV